MVKYFKKYEPRHSRISLPTGSFVPFVETETEWGVYATSNTYIQQELAKVIAKGVGGVMEIGEREYQELKKKETDSRWRGQWRETVGVNKLKRMYVTAKNGLAAAVKNHKPEIFRNFKDPASVAPPTGVSGFRPKAMDPDTFKKAFAR